MLGGATPGSDLVPVEAQAPEPTVEYLTLPDIWYREIKLFEEYRGDVEGIVVLASAMTGLADPEIAGIKPAGPLEVVIAQGQHTTISVFKSIRHQAMGYADVEIDPFMSRVSLEYRP